MTGGHAFEMAVAHESTGPSGILVGHGPFEDAGFGDSPVRMHEDRGLVDTAQRCGLVETLLPAEGVEGVGERGIELVQMGEYLVRSRWREPEIQRAIRMGAAVVLRVGDDSVAAAAEVPDPGVVLQIPAREVVLDVLVDELVCGRREVDIVERAGRAVGVGGEERRILEQQGLR